MAGWLKRQQLHYVIEYLLEAGLVLRFSFLEIRVLFRFRLGQPFPMGRDHVRELWIASKIFPFIGVDLVVVELLLTVGVANVPIALAGPRGCSYPRWSRRGARD